MKQIYPKYSPLRRETEAQLAHATSLEPRLAEEMLHELQGYQTELEMQSEQLRQSQLELEKSRGRYEDFYNIAPVGFLSVNSDGIIVEANLTAAELLKVPRRQLLYRHYTSIVVPAERDTCYRHLHSVLQHDGKLSCELTFLRGNGARFDGNMDCLGNKKEGRDTEVRIVLTDITARKQLERSMQETHDRFEKIGHLIPCIIYQFQLHPNGSTCLPYISEAFSNIFRLNPAEVCKDAAKAFDRVHPDDLESLMASIQTSAHTLTPWQHEFRLKFNDGKVVWLLGNSLPQREADGSTMWHGFLTDITAHKNAEIEKLAMQSHLQATLDAIPDLLFEMGLDGRIYSYHTSHPELLAAPPEAFLGKTVHEALPPEAVGVIMSALLEAHATGSSSGKQIKLQLPQGRFWFELSVSTKQGQGDLQQPRFILLSRDISWHKRAERALHDYTNELALHNRILKLMSQDTPLQMVLDALAREAEALHPEICCSIMLLDKGGKRLHLGAAPSLPDAYRQNLEGIVMADDKCSCGEAVCRCVKGCCMNMGVENIQQRNCKLAQLVGMQSCRTQPLVNNEKRVLGTFTVYHRQPVSHEAATDSLLENYASLAMLAIEREQARRVSFSERELKAYQTAVRGFSAHLQDIREEEKANFAREIHDDLGGTLTAIKMEAYWLAEEMSAHKETTPLLKHVELMARLTDDATSTMRHIITGMRPTILDDLGLRAAIEWHAKQFCVRTGIDCHVDCIVEDGCEHILDKVQSINLFRILQEALNNVMKHSGASKVVVEYYQGEEEVTMSIRDNGCGMPENHTINRESYGMLGMAERARQIGGQIYLDDKPGGGFSVTVKLPLSERNANEEET